MDITKLKAACAEHAKDSGGEPFSGTTTSDFNSDLKWTRATWESGVPVNKSLSRSKEAPIFIAKGTEIHGAVYAGHSSGCLVFDFHVHGAWYQTMRDEADGLLKSMGWTGSQDDFEDEGPPLPPAFYRSRAGGR